MIVAAVDLGSNTVRLLIADVAADPTDHKRLLLRTLFEDRRITRLGEGVGSSGRIQEAAAERTRVALEAFRQAVNRHAVREVVCVGTSAFRESINGQEVAARLGKNSGMDIEILSGKEEARRIFLGVEQELAYIPESLLVVDIGGGSTEFILKDRQRPAQMVSTPMGVVGLTERYLRSDPIRPEEINGLMECVAGSVLPVWKALGTVPPAEVVATAGTPTTLAAMELGMAEYDPARIHNFRMTRTQVERWFDRLSRLSLADRKAMVGLESGREDLIVSGTAILLAVLRSVGAEEWTVSEAGLREGLLVHWFLVHGSETGQTRGSAPPS
jgi:exopolyphosphatase / guanosine-5'-triphosphate,3'-diphosphate pyrophosphatase